MAPMSLECSVHPGSRALQIAKCGQYHQLCGICWTAAHKTGQCPCCQNALEQPMAKPICEYRIDRYKSASKMDFQHHLPNELLAEIIKFTKLIPMDNPKSSPHYCRPKNPAILLANSVLCTFAKMLVDAADPFFKKQRKLKQCREESQAIFRMLSRATDPNEQRELAIQIGNIRKQMEQIKMEIDENDDE